MSDLLGIGASGVRAYQNALTTTSNNIANAGSAGFARRTTDLAEVRGGNGAVANGITRSASAFRAADLRQAGTDLARTEGGVQWLERLEGALVETRLGERLGSFFDAAKGVAADPTAAAPRAVMLEQAGTLAQAFSATGARFDAIASELGDSARADVAQVNGLAANLDKINDGLRRTQPGTAAQASLLDQRDQALAAISAYADVSATFDPLGAATVRLGGGGGPVLVDQYGTGTLLFASNAEGAVQFTVSRSGTKTDVMLNGGSLAGIADGAQRLATARGEVETLAREFATGVNTVQTSGSDLNNQPGARLFDIGDPATRLSLNPAIDGAGIAAARAGAGTRDNGNLADLAELRTAGNVEGRLTGIASANAATLAARRTVADAQTAIRDGAATALGEVAGVNIDEEAVDLIRFQQAYQASSRVIQVAREILQSILAIN